MTIKILFRVAEIGIREARVCSVMLNRVHRSEAKILAGSEDLPGVVTCWVCSASSMHSVHKSIDTE
jgi:hypothetical protein